MIEEVGGFVDGDVDQSLWGSSHVRFIGEMGFGLGKR